jgi:phage repressor protein C with HTH and peptisase S24 domain
MKHEDVWRALDTLAAEHGLSASGLARKAGLDATTFNRSKRRMGDGRARWPSTESLAKVLTATGSSLETFTALVGGARVLAYGTPARGAPHGSQAGNGSPGTSRSVPLIGFAQAGAAGYFDDAGYPVGGGWEEVGLPEIADANAYALEISGDSMEPVYRAGDIVIASPAAPLRRGDRVIARTRAGEVMAKELARRSARRIELRSFNPEHSNFSFEPEEVAWMHRIVWVSQ